ncbi:MAG: pyruvate formate-lyase-activating protein [Treponema porcinum]|uniref:pyruvate formate-lyase-activating protein n=1 Tax=Treponema porcinum TaxID=261392 RepID=UPI0023563C0C|nr:pyruvate formate-lyase-activating protein [Treponema porcinum]MCI6722692.1 pyruvate formate-lyase-activating protein [Treponema porcinum]MCI7080783.1 pyruvate formate-lyase-activating protein [Treponema porcinum]MDY5048013.1 pyruvate formate-lyase-activating protein [Treponema porcinum]
MKGYIHQLESFGSVDGPGVRFIIFFAGCPLRCKYCHNPDTWDMMKGKQYTADELLDEAITCREYWGTKGGITVSGGEPLAQIDFLLELFIKAKERGINTCIDTAGGPFTREGEWFEKFKQLMNVTDVLLMDIKHINEEEHIKLTGHTGKNIIEMFRYLDEINKPVWIRHVLVPGITDNDEYLIQTRDFIRTLGNVQRVEVLPYHGLGAMKYKDLGIDYVLKDTNSPTAERVQNAREILECAKYDGWKN